MVTAANREVLSVSDLTRSAKMLLEGKFPSVFVEGEISNFSAPASGHWYFTLKDAKSQLRCAMFKGRNQRLRFVPRNGLQVIVRGKISLYEGRGDFQMIAEHMEEAGDGALRRAYELLKQKLEAEGLFATEHKQAIPALPKHLGIITSATGAAIRDVLHVLKRRFPALKTTVLPVPVQGDEAPPQIVAAIELANRYQDDPFDAILLTRGGGSLEDLWAFNTEPVARAIYASSLPIVCAVGHEVDVSIADFVADLRAPTPSAAAELLSPDQQAWQQHLDLVEQQLLQNTRNLLRQRGQQLGHLQARLRHPGERLKQLHKRFDELGNRLQRSATQKLKQPDLDNLERRLGQSMQRLLGHKDQQLFRLKTRIVSPENQLERKQTQLQRLQADLIRQVKLQQQSHRARFENATGRLNALSPLRTLERGYSIVTKGESLTDVVSTAEQLTPGDTITTRFAKGRATAEVKSVLPEEEPKS
ncbi:MAG: exodeoxyribonuclease VII large subunit [Pseudomonadales bacterium]